jgi:phosphate-selective porin OprO/OprP
MNRWAALAVAFVALLALDAAAQTVPAAEPAPAPSPSPSPSPRPADTFTLQAEGGEASVRITGYAHADGRLFPSNPDGAHTFLIRRARPMLQVSLRRRFDLVLTPDFGGGAAVLQDAYVDARYSTALRLRVGKAKAPVGLERLQSAAALLFPERAFPTALVPNRDVGMQLVGDRGPLSYAVGVFNGVVDGGSSDGDSDDDKDLAARLFLLPGRKVDLTGGSGLGLGVAVSRGTARGALPTYRTAGQLALATYRSGVTADGTRLRVSPQASFARGPVRALAEYVRSRQDVRPADEAATVEVTNEAWQVAAAWTLTGESVSGGGNPAPRSRFEPGKGWGALEIAARVGGLELDDALAAANLVDPARSAREAFAWGVGLNWYPDRHVKQSLAFERTTFDGGAATGDRQAENALFLRLQLTF